MLFKKENIQLEKIPENPTQRISDVHYDFVLEYQSDKYKRFMDIMENLQLKDMILYRLDFKFTKKEVSQSPLLYMATHFDFYATNIKHPSKYGTKYEKVFICPKCGSVEFKQISKLYWNTTQMKKKLFLEIPDDRYTGGYAIIITEKLAKIFKKQQFTGYSLEPVIHVGNKNKEKKCFQMMINNVMPPFSQKMPYILYDEDCTECQEFGKIKFPPHYDKSTLDKAKDFNLSLEKNVALGRQPLLLVSQKVKELFDILRISPVYEPIVVIK
ncbi:MAG: hypothetical protein FH761_02465 [Firmicutes bacterium]|nr:hypothetical protein [Bacillota bacterium]